MALPMPVAGRDTLTLGMLTTTWEEVKDLSFVAHPEMVKRIAYREGFDFYGEPVWQVRVTLHKKFDTIKIKDINQEEYGNMIFSIQRYFSKMEPNRSIRIGFSEGDFS